MAYLPAPELSAGNAPTSAAEIMGALGNIPVTSASMVPGVTWSAGNAPTFGFGEVWVHSPGSNGTTTVIVVGGTVAYPG